MTTVTNFHTVASFFRREFLLRKELLTITFNPNFVTLYTSVTHDSFSTLWTLLTNSISCSSTGFHLPKALSAHTAFFTYHIGSSGTWLEFKFVSAAAGARLAYWPTRVVLREGPFYAWYTKRCFILCTERWKSGGTLCTGPDGEGGINFNLRLQMGKKKKRLDNLNL